MDCAGVKCEQLTCLILTTFLLQRIKSSRQLQYISRQLGLRVLGVMDEHTKPSSTTGMLPLPKSPPMLMLS